MGYLAKMVESVTHNLQKDSAGRASFERCLKVI